MIRERSALLRLLAATAFLQGAPACSDPNATQATDLQELAAFGELVSARGGAVAAAVGSGAAVVQLDAGAFIDVPASAFSSANELRITRAEVAFDQLAPDVGAGSFYAISTRDDVPVLGAPVLLALRRPGPEVTVVRHGAAGWERVEVAAGDWMRVPIDHFSKGVFGFFEWWSEKDVLLGETIDEMDGNAKADLRQHIEAGDRNVRSFFGVDEQATQTDTEMCLEITALLKKYNTTANREFPATTATTRELAEFLFAGSSPSEEGGPYWRLTETSMQEIEDALLATEQPIGPAELLEIAIGANHGNIPLGVLAAHNYLKEITYKGRGAYTLAAGMPAAYGGPASHLRSWRQGDNLTASGEYDKMGPLYHVFAAMTGGLWLPSRASGPVIASGEAFLRTFRVGSDRPDTPKAAADQCGIDAAAWLRAHPGEDRPQPARQVTVSGTLTPTGLNPGTGVTVNTIALTYWTDGSGRVEGSAAYETRYEWERCGFTLPSSVRWALTGTYAPATRTFHGDAKEYGAGQIAYTNCSVGDVPEYVNGVGGRWEASLAAGVVTGSITLLQRDGSPLVRVTFIAR